MEWVETTGRTVEEALDAALDQLGVDADDVEYEVLEEPKPGLFGKVRVEARLRARVRPMTPRVKEPRKSRDAVVVESGVEAMIESTPADRASIAPASKKPDPKKPDPKKPDPKKAEVVKAAPKKVVRNTGPAPATVALSDDLQAVVEVARKFLAGLCEVLDLVVEFEVLPIDERTVQVGIVGQQLGFLVGQGAKTLEALQELTRTAVHQALGDRGTRLMLDVAGYRAKRRSALEIFTQRVGAEVLQIRQQRALEPMSAVDRKVVHDTINIMAGLSSSSEGEEPNRYIVLLPE